MISGGSCALAVSGGAGPRGSISAAAGDAVDATSAEEASGAGSEAASGGGEASVIASGVAGVTVRYPVEADRGAGLSGFVRVSTAGPFR